MPDRSTKKMTAGAGKAARRREAGGHPHPGGAGLAVQAQIGRTKVRSLHWTQISI